MRLSGLIRGLGALSLVHLSVAAEEPVYRRTNVSEHSGGSSGDKYEPAHFCPDWCDKTTVTSIKTETVTEHKTGSAIT